MNVLAEYLSKKLEEIYFDEFYTEIFNDSINHQELDEEGSMTEGMYIGIATIVKTFKEKDADGKKIIKSENRYIYDGLDGIHELVAEDKQPHPEEERRLTIISPVSYVGNRKLAKNARFLYALCVEIDGLKVGRKGEQIGIENLIKYCNSGALPKPTYIVCSGNGVHLYYKFIKPIPCFKNVCQSLARFKHEITRKLWNPKITILHKPHEIQYESVFQSFRMVGTRTKAGDVTRAFRFGEDVSIEYMNQWAWVIDDVEGWKKRKNIEDKRVYDTRITDVYKSENPLAIAKNKWPDWYERVVVNQEDKGTWKCKRDLYDWWKRRILEEASVGHRYFCILCLVIYAIKCRISYEELESDCYKIMQDFDGMLDKDGKEQPFDEEDVQAALTAYHSRGVSLCTYPISFITEKSGIEIKRNRRNGRKQSEHLKRTRAVQKIDYPNGEWRTGNGRPDKKDIVQKWREENPLGTKYQCIKDTGLSKMTVYKWWEYPTSED